jgi:hypothetical protein
MKGATAPPRWLGRKPLPEVARRMRVAFPELWTRYELLQSLRGGGTPPKIGSRPVGSG